MAELTEKQSTGNFNGWVKGIFIAGMLVFAFHASTHMVAAGDTWVAMACGRHFDNHKVDTVEPFSANSHKAGPTEADIRKWPGWAQSIAGNFDIETVQKWHPTGWVNQNWLTHLIFYKLATFGQADGEYNYNALVWWKFAIYIISAFCIYYSARLMGVSVPGASLAGAVALFIGRTFLDIRPAGHANMLVAIYLLVLTLTAYKDYRWVWCTVPVTVFWANVHGGYIYIFIMMFPFLGLNFLSIPFKQHLTSIGLKGIYHAIGASFAAFFAMVIFNPFRLTNLTHTFEISLSKHAESWRKVNEWHPAFEWANPVGDEIPFTIMFALALVVVIAWFLLWAFGKPVLTGKRHRKSQAYVPPKPGEYHWPIINLAAIFIAALTTYMAVRSRRFIPLGGIAACPVIILLIEQTMAMLAVKKNFNRNQKLVLPQLSKQLRLTVVGIGVVSLIGFGTFWSLKFYRIYVAPWPNDLTQAYDTPSRDSIFMRMTASNVKPFDVTRFISENNVSGRMFNYWTEGGALGFGQTPDPETGKTPLQLFMDGRAQAAYNHDKFTLWQQIYAGGQHSGMPRYKNRYATSDEMKTIAEDIDAQMKKDDIWAFVLPNSQFARDKDPRRVNYFSLCLPRLSNWRLAYIDDNQQMYVDVSNAKGKKLINDMLKGKAKFPNEYTENLILSKLYLSISNANNQKLGIEKAKAAFKINPSYISAMNLANDTARVATGAMQVKTVFEDYATDFKKNIESYSKASGYNKKLSAANIASGYLSNYYKARDKELSKQYKADVESYFKERRALSYKARW